MNNVPGNSTLFDLQKEEEELANKLRSVCNPYPLNNEKRSKLRESTEIIYRIGCVYLKKSELTTGVDQKLNFIKSAALLHGARVRCQGRLRDEVTEKKCLISLKNMQDVLMKEYVGNLSSSLVELSTEVSHNLEQARSEVKRHLEGLKILKSLQKDEFEMRKEHKISEIRSLSHYCTEFYIKQMSTIASESLKVCGPPPCKFTIAGLGSLARREVTLYSNFTHVIILEDEVQMDGNYEKLVEYFRWLSVLFQIIIIGLGETAIHKVGIESLNYLQDESKNWFHDSFTPSGIAFDRVLFQPCDTCRGNERTLENRSRFSCFIKPLSQMVEDLTNEEAVCHGYSVRDVTCKISFVFGSKELFSKCVTSCASIFANDAERNSLKTLLKEVEKDESRHWGILKYPHVVETYPRNELYRTITLLIGFAARTNGISGRSGFDKALELDKILKCESSKSIEWALAVATEIRLMSYQRRFSTRLRYDTFEYVGPKCLINCVSTIRMLMQFIGIYLPCTAIYDSLACLEEEIIRHFLHERCHIDDEILEFFDRDGFASEYLFQHCSRQKSHAAEAIVLLCNTYQLKDQTELHSLDNVENAVLGIKNYDEHPFTCLLLSFIYQYQGHISEEKKFIDFAIAKFEEVDQFFYSNDFDEETIGIQHAEAIHYFKTRLTKSSDTNWQKRYIFSLIKEHLRFDELVEARQMFRKLVKLFQQEKIFTMDEIDSLFNHQVGWLFKSLQRRKDRLKIETHKNLRSEFFEDLLVFQIAATKLAMTPDDFIAHCSGRLSDITDIFLKLQHWIFLAATEVENGHEDDGRRHLNELVEFCVAKTVSTIGTRIWVQVMLGAAIVQDVGHWSDDFIKTWEIIDDTIGIGRVSFDTYNCNDTLMNSMMSLRTVHRHKLMPTVAENYFQSCQGAVKTLEKVKFIEKVIELCQRPENLTTLKTTYWKAVCLLLNICKEDQFQEFKISVLHKILIETPKLIREEVLLKFDVIFMFQSFYENLRDRKNITALEICHYVDWSCLIMETPNICLYDELLLLRDMASSRLRNRKGSPGSSPPEGIRHLWRCLFASNTDQKTLLFTFLSEIYERISEDAFLRFQSKISTFKKSMLSDPYCDLEIISAIVDIESDVPSGVNKFWRIAVTAERKSTLQNIAIVFLCNFLVLRSNGQFTEVSSKPSNAAIVEAVENLYLCEFDKEEINLIKKLRAVCTPLGAEKQSKLRESTKILHLIGCVYLRKVAVEEGMNQKLSVIKAATLLHGARVRCQEILKDDSLERSILDSLDKMQEILMKKHFHSESYSLLGVSRNYGIELRKARMKVRKRLKKLKILKKLPKDDSDKDAEHKIFEIEEILKYCSGFYVAMMKDIANKCLEICGPKPCDFAIVGLGSLAREEVTLYSDFEHVIILEEGSQNKKDFEDILEYFRWFSILFHVIIIGIGETIIPSIGIESLNNLYSDDKNKNWFYDSFTPSGISFDGMMPHACKIPIGRQRTTKRKQHIVELIKPVSQMANFLTDKEDVVNGYHLQDVLSETCFVFGSEKLFEEFSELSESILGKRTSDIKAEIFSNEIDLISKLSTPDFELIDSKTHFYRPLSLLLGYAAREQGGRGRSGFENAACLGDIADYKDLKYLGFAFAVACEIRLKTYESKSSNRPIINVEVLEYVGAECLAHCVRVIRVLMRKVGMDINGPSAYTTLPNLKSKLLRYSSLSLGSQIEPMSFGSKFPREKSFVHRVVSLLRSVHLPMYEVLARTDFGQMLHKFPELSILTSVIHLERGHYQEAMNVTDSALDKFREFGLRHKLDEVVGIEKSGMDRNQIIHHLQTLLTTDNDEKRQMKYFSPLYREHLKLYGVDKAKQVLAEMIRVRFPEVKFSHDEFDSCFDEVIGYSGIPDDAAKPFFYKLRSNQINVRRQCLKRDEFISYCKEGFAESSEIISRSLFGKALVEEECEDEKAETRLLLRELIASWYKESVCRFIGEDWFDWMFQALRIQFHTKWWRDVIETWEMIDDVAASGKMFFPREWRLEAMYLAVEACIACCRTTGESREKVELIKKAVTICRRPENLERFQEHYYHVLRIIEVMQFEKDLQGLEILELYNVLAKTPQTDCEHNVAKSCTFFLSILLSRHLVSKQNTTTSHVSFYDLCWRLITETHHPFIWPLTYPTINIPLTTLSGDFLTGISSYKTREFESAVKMFWRIVNREKRNSHVQRLSVTFLCNSVLQFLCTNFQYTVCMNHRKAQFSVGPEEVVEKMQLCFPERCLETRRKVFAEMRKRERDLILDALEDFLTHDENSEKFDNAPISSKREKFSSRLNDLLDKFLEGKSAQDGEFDDSSNALSRDNQDDTSSIVDEIALLLLCFSDEDIPQSETISSDQAL